MRAHRYLPRTRRSRRALISALVAGACAAATPAIGLPGSDASPEPEPAGGAGRTGERPIRLSLPEPTGPHAIGRTNLHLVDRERADPWDEQRRRELMVSVWYPARAGDGGERAPYMSPGAGKVFAEGAAKTLKLPTGSVDWAGTRTHARSGADVAPAVARSGRGAPVVLFSPGMYNERALGSTYAEQLASEGYVVVTIDHPGEAHAVEFPDGRVVETSPKIAAIEGQAERWRRTLQVRVADTRFVADAVRALARGENPDAEQRALPDGLAGAVDAQRLGMLGHSLGGTTTAEAMRRDTRIDAGANLDGPLGLHWTDPKKLLPVAKEGLDRPFLLSGTNSLPRKGDGTRPQTHETSPSWRSFWQQTTSWKRDLSWPEAAHNSLTDYQTLLPQLDRRAQLPEGLRKTMIGTVDPQRSVHSQQVLLSAFFDQQLRDQSRPVLDGPTPEHPDVRFVR